MKKWLNDIDGKHSIQSWVQHHLRALYFLAVICGSAYTAVLICDSNLFHLRVFGMGLNARQKAKFKNKRVFSTVLLENVPQLILQFVYSVIIEDVTLITIFSSIFSLLSIIVTVFEYLSARLFLATETVLIVKLTIHSNDISTLSNSNFRKLQNLRLPLRNEISKIIDIDVGLIELLKPTHTRNGCYLTFNIRIKSTEIIAGASQNAMTLIKDEIDSGRLSKIFYKIWNENKHLQQNNGDRLRLRKMPQIVNIETKEIKPEQNLRGETSDFAAVINMTGSRNVSIPETTVKTHNQLRTTSNSSLKSGNNNTSIFTNSATPKTPNHDGQTAIEIVEANGDHNGYNSAGSLSEEGK